MVRYRLNKEALEIVLFVICETKLAKISKNVSHKGRDVITSISFLFYYIEKRFSLCYYKNEVVIWKN